jgi:hypothetical protein
MNSSRDSMTGRLRRGAARAMRVQRTALRYAAMRPPASPWRAVARRAAGRRLREAPDVRTEMREGIRYREENTAADRIAVCSLEKLLSRRP